MAVTEREFPPGERIPGTIYQVIRRIGSGGMGTVYDVEDTTIGKRYVLKALHPQLGDRADLARRMRNEARTLARLNHPNIVEVITAGVTDDDMKLPYYVMERLNGQSLRVVLEKKGQLELPHACHIAIDLLDALDHAHDKGVIHRDVTPDNIFLHRTPSAVTVTKLLDFGIVSLLDGGNGETAGRFLGTLRYAAPEQLRGEKPSPRMDVYCAGLVLYEMIAGHGPFDDQGDSNRIAAAHLNRQPPPLSSFADIPPELGKIVAASLQKRPEDRPRDAFSFAASLRNLKRALAPVRGQESTESRATSPAVDGAPGGAAVVEVRQASPGGPYVVAPTPAPQAPSRAPRTTIKGISAPPASADASPTSATPTSPQPVDRGATTGYLGEGNALGPTPASAGGTEGFAPHAPPAYVAEPHVPFQAPPPMRWPSERPPARSEDPHVMRAGAGAPRATGKAALVVTLGLGVAAGLAVVGALVMGVLKLPRAATHEAPANVAPEGLPVSVPAPVFTAPAPTIAPPGLEDPVVSAPRTTPTASASATPAVASSVSASAVASPPVAPPRPGRAAPRAAATTAPAATGAAQPDKPGPGF